MVRFVFLFLTIMSVLDLYAQCPFNCISRNSFFGESVGDSLTTGDSNSFFGYFSGHTTTEGNNNSFFGNRSGFRNKTGNLNSFFGNSSGRDNVTGGSNCFFGESTGGINSTGSYNSFYGRGSGGANSTGSHNSFYGRSSGALNSTGSNNSFFGEYAGFSIISGSSNVMLGHGAGPTIKDSTISNRLFIDVVDDLFGNDEPLIYGEFDNDFVRINGSFEVTAGLNNPSSIRLKERFSTVSPSVILSQINGLNIAEWSYKSDPDIRHIGPTAESFYQAFGLGSGSDNISTIDADGVSLIAIQALSEELSRMRNNAIVSEQLRMDIESQLAAQKQEIAQQNQEITDLKERLEKIESLLHDHD